MKLKDLLTKDNYNKYGDMDVYNDCIDEMAPCWCGVTIKDEYLHCYPILELEAEIEPDTWLGGSHYRIMLNINDLPEGKDEKAWEDACELFEDLAGYGDADEYVERFEEPEYPEYEEPDPALKMGTIGWLKNELTDDRKVMVVDFNDAPNINTVYIGNVKGIPDKYDTAEIQGYIPYPAECTTVII